MMLNNHEVIELVTDPRQCAFGEFLYSEKGRKLAQSDPEMGRLLEEIVPFHAEVHESAKGILAVWKPPPSRLKKHLESPS